MAKLMGLDYVIQFRKGKENVAADALSCCQEEGTCEAILAVVPDWLQEVTVSYHQDDWAKGLLDQLSVAVHNRPRYSLNNGILRYKG